MYPIKDIFFTSIFCSASFLNEIIFIIIIQYSKNFRSSESFLLDTYNIIEIRYFYVGVWSVCVCVRNVYKQHTKKHIIILFVKNTSCVLFLANPYHLRR